jgi:PKD repeat protein
MKNHSYRLLILLVISAVPLTADASVRISEIAWMGTGSSYDEWIELHNSSDTNIDLSGWSLTWADTKLVIGDDESDIKETLGSTIAPDSYYLLERTDDTSAAPEAGAVYTGALANSGAVLTLRDRAGAIVDRVAGGESWEAIGGDNASGQTPQRYDNRWVTAAPTPAAATPAHAARTEAADESSDDGAAPTDADETPHSITVVQRPKDADEPTMQRQEQQYEPGVTFSVPEYGSVHTPLEMTAAAHTQRHNVTRVTEFRWSLGDGGIARGSSVTHTYQYPGTYTVQVRASVDGQQYRERTTLAVIEPALTLEPKEERAIAVHNRGSRAIDLSGWSLSAGSERFNIPADTIIAANATIVLSEDVTDLAPATVLALRYPDNEIAATHAAFSETDDRTTEPREERTQERKEEGAEQLERDRLQRQQINSVASSPNARSRPSVASRSQSDTAAATATMASAAPQYAAASARARDVWPWALGALALVGIAAISAIVVRHGEQDLKAQAAHYALIEDDDTAERT